SVQIDIDPVLSRRLGSVFGALPNGFPRTTGVQKSSKIVPFTCPSATNEPRRDWQNQRQIYGATGMIRHDNFLAPLPWCARQSLREGRAWAGRPAPPPRRPLPAVCAARKIEMQAARRPFYWATLALWEGQHHCGAAGGARAMGAADEACQTTGA